MTESRSHRSAATRALLAFGALAATAILAACASGDSSTTPAGDAGGGDGGSATTGGDSGSGSTEVPASVTIGGSQKILTLDPDQAADGYSEGVVHLIGGTLYELQADGSVIPLLAEGDGKVSDDGMTWTFELKPDLKFSDGSPLTSEDVKATIERAKADKENVYAGFTAPIETVEAPSPTKVVMKLNRPYPSLQTIMSQPEMVILPTEGLAKGKDFFNEPVGAGQYMVESWGGSPKAVLKRNPNYAGTPPAVETLTFQTIEDFNARMAQVQSGQLDFATDMPSRLLANPPQGLVGNLTPHYGFTTLPLNVNSKPLDEAGVRKAISKAVDRQQINETVWNGETNPIAEFWPSTMTGYDESVSVERDIEGAKADLKGTSCENGCEVEFMYSSANPWAEPTATIVAQNLKDIGIDVKLQKIDDATFNERLSSTDFQMAQSFLYDYNDVPDGMLTYAMTADGGLNANYTGFKPGKDIQDAVNTAITKDGEERTKALADINTLFGKYQPFVTLSDYSVGTISRYDPSVVKSNEAGFINVAREGQ